jgi:hypothetical protein
MKWTLETVAKQAVVLYAMMAEKAINEDDEQSRSFWESHRNTAFSVLHGTDKPVTDDEIDLFVDAWNRE